jgi:hypothetical protein
MGNLVGQSEPFPDKRALRVEPNDQFTIGKLKQASLKSHWLFDYSADTQFARQGV